MAGHVFAYADRRGDVEQLGIRDRRSPLVAREDVQPLVLADLSIVQPDVIYVAR